MLFERLLIIGSKGKCLHFDDLVRIEQAEPNALVVHFQRVESHIGLANEVQLILIYTDAVVADFYLDQMGLLEIAHDQSY